jgi:hypothetical protein
MKNERDFSIPGSAHVSCAGDGVPAITDFFPWTKMVAAGRRNQHSRRVRYPDIANPPEEELS